ncbi:MAG: sigma-70 family RNA polymerase sigma factor [Candidatus Goldiibacteriota bacterium]|jgi:RNA polymerase sigma-70 factor (ECF subfamily)
MQEIDIETVKKAQRGDRAAFDRIIKVYRQTITDLCRRYMRNSEEALDMAQDVFCAAYTSMGKFEHKSKFSTWLYRVAVNLCINRLDMLKRRKYYDTGSIAAVGDGGEEYEIQIRDKARGADEELESADTRRMIMGALEEFDAESKNVVILRDMQGLEYEEISSLLGLPLGSVKSKLNRAREKLKEIIIKRSGEKR